MSTNQAVFAEELRFLIIRSMSVLCRGKGVRRAHTSRETLLFLPPAAVPRSEIVERIIGVRGDDGEDNAPLHSLSHQTALQDMYVEDQSYLTQIVCRIRSGVTVDGLRTLRGSPVPDLNDALTLFRGHCLHEKNYRNFG